MLSCPKLHHFKILSLGLLVVCAGCAALSDEKSAGQKSDSKTHSNLVIVLDGLRPDYVTREMMPNLHALGKRGVVFNRHHSVFPTVTRVNASSIVSGAYPRSHGILGNSILIPEVSPTRVFSTASLKDMEEADAATHGQLQTVPSLGELMDKAGKKLLVISTGSSGSAYLMNRKISGGAIIHGDFVRPESLRPRVIETLGETPPESEPNLARNHRAVDAYLKLGLEELKPETTIMWLCDPDHTAHGAGIGSPLTLQALKGVDDEVGRIIRTLEEKKIRDQVNIFVVSDHGFSTHTGPANLSGLLISNKLKEGPKSSDVVVVEGAIFVKDHDKEKIRQIVQLLQKTPWVGAIFTKRSIPTHPEGFIPGTMGLSTAHWDHPRAADILVSANWTDAKNQYGFAGTTTLPGVAGHGTSSPWDIHNTLIAAGPEIKAGIESDVPSANIDLAPTLCFLMGMERPGSMDGRILREALRGGPDPRTVKVLDRIYRSEARRDGGNYKVELFESSVDGTDYLDYTKVGWDF